MMLATTGEEIHKSLGLLSLNHKRPIFLTMNEPNRKLPSHDKPLKCQREKLQELLMLSPRSPIELSGDS